MADSRLKKKLKKGQRPPSGMDVTGQGMRLRRRNEAIEAMASEPSYDEPLKKKLKKKKPVTPPKFRLNPKTGKREKIN